MSEVQAQLKYRCEIGRREGRIEILFRDWTENRGRQASVELEILREVGWAEVDSTLERVILSRPPHRTEWEFDHGELRKVLKVLRGFLVPVEMSEELKEELRS